MDSQTPPISNADFLKAAFGADWPRAHVCAFPYDPGKARAGAWAGGPAEHLASQLKAEANTYYAISLFRPEEGTGNARRRKELFDGCYVIPIDDIGEKVDPERITLEPSYKIETSPGSEQWGFFLKVPERDAGKVERLLDGLKAAKLTDTQFGDLARYSRLPVGSNLKAKCNGGYQVTTKAWNPDRRFTVEEIATGLGIDLAGAPADNIAEVERDAPDGFLTSQQLCDMLREIKDGARNTSALKCAGALINRGFTDEMIRMVIGPHMREGFDDQVMIDQVARMRRDWKIPDPGTAQEEPRPLQVPPQPIGIDLLTGVAPAPPPSLVPTLIPIDLHRIVGPGGVTKTTVTLWAMIRLIAGRDVFGIEPERRGPCLFVTAEDTAELVRYRIRQLCDAMHLDDHERRLVAEQLHLRDVSGERVMLAELDRNQNLVPTDHVHDHVRTWTGEGLVWTVFDPMSYFTPGERFVNDGETATNRSLRFIARELECAVGAICHTGQEAARSKTVDQYAGRGGSAGADNSRAVLVLVRHDPEDSKNHPPPVEIGAAAIQRGAVSRLHCPKFSYGAREARAIWLVRDELEPFRFHCYMGHENTVELRQQRAEEEREALRTGLAHRVWRYLNEAAAKGHKPQRVTVEDELAGVTIDNKAAGRNDVRGAISRALAEGAAIELELPPEEKCGGRRTYLAPGREER